MIMMVMHTEHFDAARIKLHTKKMATSITSMAAIAMCWIFILVVFGTFVQPVI